MSPLFIICMVAFLYLKSKPELRFFIERDGQYLSREWTSFINAFFIVLVVCSHGVSIIKPDICTYLHERRLAFMIAFFGQLMVTTFFFYSGYGIMYSLLNRGGYVRKLIFPRFVSLSFNFTLAVMVYFAVHCILQNEIRWADFVVGLHDFQALGNPTWFILMTLLTYLLTFVSFVFIGEKQPAAFVLILTALIIVSIYLVGRIKPAHWVNTILCFPAGMFYYLKGDQFEETLRKTRIPSIVYAILFMLAGCSINAAGLWPNTYTENLGGILFAVGVTWLVGSFSWKAPSRFLIWLGGSGLFVVYMFHLLPMRIISTLGLNDGNPYLVWLGVAITAAILVFVFYHTYKHLNRLLFSK